MGVALKVERQQVLGFAEARATAEEIKGWKADLVIAQGELEDAKETLEKSKAFRDHSRSKERVKELAQRISEAQDGLVEGLAAHGQ